jgi:hypothetical protein
MKFAGFEIKPCSGRLGRAYYMAVNKLEKIR